MDSLDVAKACLRRWYVCLPIVVLAVLAGMWSTQGGLPSYSATGSFALVYTHAAEIKPNETDPRLANPLVAGGPQLLKEALVADLMSTSVQQQLSQPGVSGVPPETVTVGQNVQPGQAFSLDSPRNTQSIVVTAYGADPQAVRETVVRALEAVPDRLAAIQGEFKAPERSQYTSFITAAPQMSQFPPPSRTKTLIALGGVGVMAGAALSLLVDRLVSRRRERRELEPRRERPRRGRRGGRAADDDLLDDEQLDDEREPGSHGSRDLAAESSLR